MNFSERMDSDKVLPLSDDGYLFGEMETLDEITGEKTYQNSKTDPNSISVAEAKKIDEEKFKNSFTLNEFVTLMTHWNKKAREEYSLAMK